MQNICTPVTVVFDSTQVVVSKQDYKAFEKDIQTLAPGYLLPAFLIHERIPDPFWCAPDDMVISDFAIAHWYGKAIGYSYRCEQLLPITPGGVFVDTPFRLKGVGAMLAIAVGLAPKRGDDTLYTAAETHTHTYTYR